MAFMDGPYRPPFRSSRSMPTGGSPTANTRASRSQEWTCRSGSLTPSVCPEPAPDTLRIAAAALGSLRVARHQRVGEHLEQEHARHGGREGPRRVVAAD